MTPNSFVPCATFARDTLAIPPVLYACKRRPATKAAIAAAEREWKRRWTQSRYHTVPIGVYRIHVHMGRAGAPTEDGIGTNPVFWVGLAKANTDHGLGIFNVGVPALPIEGLPARLHTAALGLLARYADTLTQRAAALTTEAAAVRALIPAPPSRPTCALCGTDADAPMAERLILTPAIVHAACSAVSDHTPEPGEAIDRLPDFVETHLPDAPERSLRHTQALAALSRDYPGILNIAAALKAAQSTK